MAYSLKRGSKEAYSSVVLRDVTSQGHWEIPALTVPVNEGSISPQLPASACARHSSKQHLSHHIASLLPGAGSCLLWETLCCWWATYIFLLFETLQEL